MSVSNFYRDNEQSLPAVVNTVMPETFKTCMLDFVRDLSLSFKEYSYLWSNINANLSPENWNVLYAYCAKVYPAAFMTIIYANDDHMQDISNDMNMDFLPNVNFRMIFGAEGVTETIKYAIWKYLQAILYILIPHLETEHAFGGDMLDVFAAMDEDVLAAKLQETADSLSAFFTNVKLNEGAADDCAMDTDDQNQQQLSGPSFEFENVPRAEEVNSKLHDLMGGKLGQFANELAEEFQARFASDPEMAACTNAQEMMAYLGRHPAKFASILHTMSSRLRDKIRSGEMTREEVKAEMDKMLASFCDMNPTDMEAMLSTMAAAGHDVGGIREAVRREQAKRRMREKAAGASSKRDRAPVVEPVVDPYAGLSKYERQQRRKIDRIKENQELDAIAAFINS